MAWSKGLRKDWKKIRGPGRECTACAEIKTVTVRTVVTSFLRPWLLCAGVAYAIKSTSQTVFASSALWLEFKGRTHCAGYCRVTCGATTALVALRVGRHGSRHIPRQRDRRAPSAVVARLCRYDFGELARHHTHATIHYVVRTSRPRRVPMGISFRVTDLITCFGF